MSCWILTLLAILSPVQSLNVAVSADVRSATRPVSKAITLLQDMLKELDKESGEDALLYAKMQAWCKENESKEAKSTVDNGARIRELKAMIEEYKATLNQLNIDIPLLKEEIARNEQALKKATALRAKQRDQFVNTQQDLLASMDSLDAAIAALSAHNSFLQIGSNTARISASVAASMQHVMQKHEQLLKHAFTRVQRRNLMSLFQLAKREDSTSDYHPEYAPQSTEIYGMLTQMKETFRNNLDKMQAKEMENQKAFDALKTSLEAEIASGKETLTTKTKEQADTKELMAQAKEELRNLQDSVNAEESFLDKIRLKCKMNDQEYEDRMITRNKEKGAIQQALDILTNAKSQAIFARSFDSSTDFLQVKSAYSSKGRTEASKLLSKTAERFNSPRLAALATKVRLDAFTEVKKAIDIMVKELLEEKAHEYKKKDYCNSKLNENTITTDLKDNLKTDLEAKIATLESEISELQGGIDVLKGEVSGLISDLKAAGEQRKAENKEFMANVVDQKATQGMLEDALMALEKFYGKVELLQKGAVTRVQKKSIREEPARIAAPPSDFNKYAKQDKAVLVLISEIIKNSKDLERDATNGEIAAVEAFKTYSKETGAVIGAKQKEMAGKMSTKAGKEADKMQASKDLEETNKELEDLNSEKLELHENCDFLLHNFNVRIQARDEEIAALNQAKAILSGSKFDLFLQKDLPSLPSSSPW